MSTQTLEQKRAQDALAKVQAVAKDEEVAACYRSYAESLPAHIVMGGLGQALATEWAAARIGEGKSEKPGRKAHKQLGDDLALWLKTQKVYATIDEKKPAESLIEALMKGDQKKYLQAQAEALAWLLWLKKFCQAMLPKGKTTED